MYFAYIDESGNSNENDPKSQEYVLTAVIVHEMYWKTFQDACRNLKQDIWELLNESEIKEMPETFELHFKDLTNRENDYEKLKENDELWLKIVDEIYTRISWLDIDIISSIIVKDEFKKKNYTDVNKWAFTLLVERLNRFLEENHPDLDEYILLVLDTVNPEFDAQQRKHIEEFMESGTGHGWKEYPTNVIETPFFVDSHIHNGVQIADAAAYLIRRYTFHCLNRNPDAFFNKYCLKFMRKISKIFYGGTSKHKHVFNRGIKIFPHKFIIGSDFWRIFY